MGFSEIEGVILTPLKKIDTEKGPIMHGLKMSSEGFYGFGEAYFSQVDYNKIKGWKKHTEMFLNIIVPVGAILFVLYDDRLNSKSFGNFSSIELSNNNYFRLTVPKGIWMAFKGISPSINLLLNIASIEHKDHEAENLPIDHEKFKGYEW